MSGAVMCAEAQAFDQTQDYNALVIHHSPLVKRIAYHLMSRLPFRLG
jgi:DNA-directed RNA polymerase specialized sigma subunit